MLHSSGSIASAGTGLVMTPPTIPLAATWGAQNLFVFLNWVPPVFLNSMPPVSLQWDSMQLCSVQSESSWRSSYVQQETLKQLHKASGEMGAKCLMLIVWCPSNCTIVKGISSTNENLGESITHHIRQKQGISIKKNNENVSLKIQKKLYMM